MALASESGSAESPAGATTRPQLQRLRWWTMAWTIALCVTCIVLPDFAYDRSVNALSTPETAMSGPARVEGRLGCLAPFLGAMALLALATARHAFSKVTRAWAVLPALAMLPVYGAHRNAVDAVEAVPAFHQDFRASEVDLDKWADAVALGERVALPAPAGRFQIIRGDRLENAAIVLYTKQAGPYVWGFVRNEGQEADSGPATIIGVTGPVGSNHCVQRLGGRWFVLYSRYWFHKRGWS
jgi:hypothetical protein